MQVRIGRLGVSQSLHILIDTDAKPHKITSRWFYQFKTAVELKKRTSEDKSPTWNAYVMYVNIKPIPKWILQTWENDIDVTPGVTWSQKAIDIQTISSNDLWSGWSRLPTSFTKDQKIIYRFIWSNLYPWKSWFQFKYITGTWIDTMGIKE